MRKLILASMAAIIVGAPVASLANAEETTVIKHDGGDKTVVRKEQQLNILPAPHVEDKKTVIKKDRD